METSNAPHNLTRFGEMVLADRQLHDQLRAAPDEAAFVALAVRLAAERGCEFPAPVVAAALGERRRAWQERWL